MFSTPEALRVWSVGSLLAVLLAGGCQSFTAPRREPPEVVPVNLSANESTDEAMDLRVWDRTAVIYPDGDVVAGPTGFLFRISDQTPDWGHLLLEPVLFVGQTIALPVVYPAQLMTANPTRYRGADVEPTHDAVPPVVAEKWE